MFRRADHDLPKDPDYPSDLHALGFVINEHGQFVKIEQPEQFFDFFHTDNERANQVRKERLHECVRQSVLASLAAQGVDQVYVYGAEVSMEKPQGPHTSILATNLERLKTKRDVLIVVNEDMQDLGIWAYRLLMREAGIDGGSAVGLVKQLQSWGVVSDSDDDGPARVSMIGRALKKLKLDGAEPETDNDNVPGLIVLNSGQLIYSHEHNKAMSQADWLGRPRATALTDHYRIDETHNRVPGHKTAEEHVANVFEHVLPALTRADVRLYVVGLSEGGEAVLKYLDAKFLADRQDPIGNKIEAIALMQPTHNPSQLQSAALATFLAGRRCRAYVMSDSPTGSLIGVPQSAPRTASFDDELQKLPDIQTGIAGQVKHGSGHHREGSASSTSPAIAIPGSSPDPVHPSVHIRTRSRPSCPLATSANSLIPSDWAPSRSLEAKSSTHSLSHSTVALQDSNASLPPASDGALEQSTDTISTSLALRAAADADARSASPDPYADVQVSCPTFSSGPLSDGVTEVLWPAVMEVVVQWLKDVAEEAEADRVAYLESRGSGVGFEGFEDGDAGDGVELDGDGQEGLVLGGEK
ncbi:hypothetical protein B0A50_06462 [Salinomyces thailandicus]|uniref:Arb2 domain-containing protein n=1 Tax=Salinomyces thailandicus TaxID=706561 RepID=A0A4U0TQ13_9PEZI|nr:hypothetical protein B0A50_06462 [Salinomyces thailandica]